VQEGAAYLPCQEITGLASSEEPNMIVVPSCSLCKGAQIDNPVTPCERDLDFRLKARPIFRVQRSSQTSEPTGGQWRTPMMRWRRVEKILIQWSEGQFMQRIENIEEFSKLGEITRDSTQNRRKRGRFVGCCSELFLTRLLPYHLRVKEGLGVQLHGPWAAWGW
jgi:hypothetical protein